MSTTPSITPGEVIAELEEALIDADSALHYIRSRYGFLNGVGWERVDNKTCAALSRARAYRDQHTKEGE